MVNGAWSPEDALEMKHSTKYLILTAYVGFVAYTAILLGVIFIFGRIMPLRWASAYDCISIPIFLVGGYFVFRKIVREHFLPDPNSPEEISTERSEKESEVQY
jgi:hypothetical protein